MSMFADMTLQELNALAERQRRQIEEQEKSLQMKQKKLTVLNQQQQQNNSASDDRLRKLRERALEQENRLKHFRMTGDQNTALLSAELTAVRDLLESKQRELNQSILKVDKITQGLSELQKTQESSATGEIGKLNRELGALHNLNSEQSKKLQSQRELLRRKQNESAELDRKILDLADRINKKKMAQQHQGNVYTNVAPVKPVVQDKLQPDLPNPKNLNNISRRHEMPPNEPGPTRRDVKPTIATLPSKQDQIFMYRQPTGATSNAPGDRPPPPIYADAIKSNKNRVLPGQAKRGKLVNNKRLKTGDGGGSPESKDAFSEWRRRIANQPRPLKKRSSFSEAEGSNGPRLYQQLYQRSDPLFRDPRNVTQEEEEEGSEGSATPQNQKEKDLRGSPRKTDSVNELTRRFGGTGISEESGTGSDQTDGQNQITKISPMKQRTRVKGILKPQNAPTNSIRRVQFDPLALLLDASLEGELELVKRVIDKVPNPSAANDEGITALHNSVCAGHFDVVRFLVHWGVDINAADSDGWTPLHCAASCNSVQMVKFLVENGAQIFAETYSDNETAAEKCEELDEGYGMCSDYLYGTQEKLGSVNKCCVYALFDYEAQNSDEISFREGDLLSIQRKSENGDEHWWLARHGTTGKEGFVPRNYLGMWPRIKASHAADP